ncbi:MAG TPA: hypothetical protein VHW70_00655 [Edaphobacter sp.]|nr:hypothetical protein [Edaphobacter sp.]
MAIGAEYQNLTPSRSVTESPSCLRLQQLIDTGTLYVAQNLSSAQFATLQAIAARILHPNAKDIATRLDAVLSARSCDAISFAPAPLLAFDYHLGLDELDIIARTHAGYPFADLPAEIQDALLGLIASRHLTTRKLDLALWLEDLHTTAAAF